MTSGFASWCRLARTAPPSTRSPPRASTGHVFLGSRLRTPASSPPSLTTERLPSACGWCHQPPQGTRTPELLVMSRAHRTCILQCTRLEQAMKVCWRLAQRARSEERVARGSTHHGQWPGVQFVRWLRASRHRRLRRSPDHVSALSRRITRIRIRWLSATISRRALICPSRFPAAFPPPALASWPSCARRGVGRSSRSAYRPAKRRPDLDGVSTFRTHKTRPVKAPSIARGRRCSPRPATITSPRPPLLSGTSLHPPRPSIHAGLCLTSHQRGFKQFARPDFPSPVAPGWIKSALGFPPSSAPRDYSQRTPGRGQGLSSTDPKPALRHQPNLQPRGFT
jgi:hypothetical protein